VLWLGEAARDCSSPKGPQVTAWPGERGKGRQAQASEASEGAASWPRSKQPYYTRP
jgi:hypothetical protein